MRHLPLSPAPNTREHLVLSRISRRHVNQNCASLVGAICSPFELNDLRSFYLSISRGVENNLGCLLAGEPGDPNAEITILFAPVKRRAVRMLHEMERSMEYEQVRTVQHRTSGAVIYNGSGLCFIVFFAGVFDTATPN
ncbi:hypothetical protein RRG08_049423 [Elysia crispata]|uniref:Uncharacterized protein n=1 Tax=Elysia crispata TaxID=231223 RepID=A0AAE0ZSC9_9GAST|nr:hypothetical protein RRG08_049423 [Elysia crispata]